jgi:prolyl-tRNA editing enzyme YbaK/EbsC (Cys-tRNA(Pro) deacylase)
MTAAWPKGVERVAEFLRAAGAEARLEELRTATSTAAEAASAVGAKRGQIVKSLVVVCDGAPALVLVAGDRRADLEKVRRALGAATGRIATAEEVRETTGFAPGGVAPFPNPSIEHALVDRTLLAHPVVWAGGGSAQHLICLDPAELVRLTRGRPMDVVEEPAYHSQPDTDGKEP